MSSTPLTSSPPSKSSISSTSSSSSSSSSSFTSPSSPPFRHSLIDFISAGSLFKKYDLPSTKSVIFLRYYSVEETKRRNEEKEQNGETVISGSSSKAKYGMIEWSSRSESESRSSQILSSTSPALTSVSAPSSTSTSTTTATPFSSSSGSFLLGELVDVYVGKQTPSLLQPIAVNADEKCCFSMLTKRKGTELHLEAIGGVQVVDMWLEAVNLILTGGGGKKVIVGEETKVEKPKKKKSVKSSGTDSKVELTVDSASASSSSVPSLPTLNTELASLSPIAPSPLAVDLSSGSSCVDAACVGTAAFILLTTKLDPFRPTLQPVYLYYQPPTQIPTLETLAASASEVGSEPLGAIHVLSKRVSSRAPSTTTSAASSPPTSPRSSSTKSSISPLESALQKLATSPTPVALSPTTFSKETDALSAIKLHRIIKINVGEESEIVRNGGQSVEPDLCFSIVTKLKSTDLQMEGEDDLKMWLTAINHILTGQSTRVREKGSKSTSGKLSSPKSKSANAKSPSTTTPSASPPSAASGSSQIPSSSSIPPLLRMRSPLLDIRLPPSRPSIILDRPYTATEATDMASWGCNFTLYTETLKLPVFVFYQPPSESSVRPVPLPNGMSTLNPDCAGFLCWCVRGKREFIPAQSIQLKRVTDVFLGKQQSHFLLPHAIDAKDESCFTLKTNHQSIVNLECATVEEMNGWLIFLNTALSEAGQAVVLNDEEEQAKAEQEVRQAELRRLEIELAGKEAALASTTAEVTARKAATAKMAAEAGAAAAAVASNVRLSTSTTSTSRSDSISMNGSSLANPRASASINRRMSLTSFVSETVEQLKQKRPVSVLKSMVAGLKFQRFYVSEDDGSILKEPIFFFLQAGSGALSVTGGTIDIIDNNPDDSLCWNVIDSTGNQSTKVSPLRRLLLSEINEIVTGQTQLSKQEDLSAFTLVSQIISLHIQAESPSVASNWLFGIDRILTAMGRASCLAPANEAGSPPTSPKRNGMRSSLSDIETANSEEQKRQITIVTDSASTSSTASSQSSSSSLLPPPSPTRPNSSISSALSAPRARSRSARKFSVSVSTALSVSNLSRHPHLSFMMSGTVMKLHSLPNGRRSSATTPGSLNVNEVKSELFFYHYEPVENSLGLIHQSTIISPRFPVIKTFDLRYLLDVFVGASTPALKAGAANCDTSFALVSVKQEFNLEANYVNDANTWLEGIKFILSQSNRTVVEEATAEAKNVTPNANVNGSGNENANGDIVSGGSAVG